MFKKYFPEHVPKAIERYAKEINRVTGVLDGHLARQKEEHAGSAGGDGPWLVGNKLSYADLAFIPWQTRVAMALEKEEFDADSYPNVKEWLGKMNSREAVKKAMEMPRH